MLMIIVSFTCQAQVTRHEVKLGHFSRLSLLDDINVNYRCHADSAGLAVFTCTQEVADHLIFTINSSGRLSIQVDDAFERQGNLPTITLYSKSLDEVENSGDSTLRVSGLPPMKAFKVRLIDNGKVIARALRIIADGSCDELALRLVGTGEIQADNVLATSVSCRIMGTGTIGCNVNGGELKVSGSGTGKVYYKGQPSKVTVRKLGTIKAIPME